jgi:hypothetical protein
MTRPSTIFESPTTTPEASRPTANSARPRTARPHPEYRTLFSYPRPHGLTRLVACIHDIDSAIPPHIILFASSCSSMSRHSGLRLDASKSNQLELSASIHRLLARVDPRSFARFSSKHVWRSVGSVIRVSHRMTELKGKPKAEVVVAVVRRVVVPIRRPAVLRGVPVTATAVDAVRALMTLLQQ